MAKAWTSPRQYSVLGLLGLGYFFRSYFFRSGARCSPVLPQGATKRSVLDLVSVGLHVQIPRFERVLFDEFPPALDVFAHQCREYLFAFDGVFQAHFEQRALLGVHGGLGELLGIHLAQAFVALDGRVLLALVLDIAQQVTPV